MARCTFRTGKNLVVVVVVVVIQQLLLLLPPASSFLFVSYAILLFLLIVIIFADCLYAQPAAGDSPYRRQRAVDCVVFVVLFF